VKFPRDRQALAHHWLVLAIAALAGSGTLALGVALARVPLLAPHLGNTDLARRLLVVHVGLGVVIWFSAVPVALFHLHRLAAGGAARARLAAALAPWLSTAGMVALLTGLVPGLGRVHPVNYVPVVAHPLYVTGLALFFTGAALSYLEPGAVGASRRTPSSPGSSAGGRLPDLVTATLASTGALVTVGALYVLLSLAAAGAALVRLPVGLDEGAGLELLMWGPGHLLQFANVAFVIVAWALLSAWGSGRKVGGPGRWVTLALVVPLVPILVLLVRGPMWWFSRSGYVLLMQWALFPAVLIFLSLVLAPHFGRREAEWHAPTRAALWPLAGSVALMLVGFLYGALIRGSDLRIPGHYHACIGSVTLAYMALTLLLPEAGSGASDSSAALRRVAVLYGVGQLVFSTGLVLAGSYGLGRKTYGVEQQIGNPGQGLGVWVMAAGGLLAFAGGAVWAAAAFRRLSWPRPTGPGRA